MPKLSKSHPMKGSLSYGFKPAEVVYDSKVSAYFLRDTVAKKRYGPFTNTKSIRAAGYTFYIDGGIRATRTKINEEVAA